VLPVNINIRRQLTNMLLTMKLINSAKIAKINRNKMCEEGNMQNHKLGRNKTLTANEGD
jgi:hypothetical protein